MERDPVDRSKELTNFNLEKNKIKNSLTAYSTKYLEIFFMFLFVYLWGLV